MDPEQLCNTTTTTTTAINPEDDETLIRERKRLRRVSFAENTEVHVFDRDDEDNSHETPPLPPSPSPLPNTTFPPLVSLNQPQHPNNDEDEEPRNNFDSSSPGSAISSTATSNDEERYFGEVVSVSFIRQGREPDSAASDEHELTLDSTAFSMQFQSLARSDSASVSASNWKTPTPSFEGKSGSGSLMTMTGVKRRIPWVLGSGGTGSGGEGSDSNAMSLVEKNLSEKYDYAKLSPTLEALLAGTGKGEDNANGMVADQMSVLKSGNHIESESMVEEVQASKVYGMDREDASIDEMIGVENGNLNEANAGHIVTPIRKSGKDYLVSTETVTPVLVASTDHQNQTLPESIKRQRIHLDDLDQQGQHVKLAHMEHRHKSDDTSASNANALVSGANRSLSLGKLKATNDKDSRYQIQTSQKDYGNIGDFVTPMRGGSLLTSPFGSSELNFITRTDPAKTGEKFPEQYPLHKSASPRVRRTSTAIRLEKRLLEGTVQSHSGKETQLLSDSDRLHHFLRKGPLSYTNAQSSDAVKDVYSSGWKRKIAGIEPMSRNKSDGVSNNYPKVTETEISVSEYQLDHHPVGNEVQRTREYEAQGHWNNVVKELSGAVERFLYPSIGELSNWELDKLEEVFERMQKAAKYEKLSTLVRFQRTLDPLTNHHLRRKAEARWLQDTLVYEHAKSLLLRTKQDRLQRKVKLLQSGVQERQKLKFSMKSILQNGSKDTQSKDVTLPLSDDRSRENVDIYDEVIAKRQELGSLDMKVKSLMKSLLASCKIKEEPSLDESLMLINDCLRKRMRCRLIQKELQLCQVDRLEKGTGHCNLVLNYCNVLHQSFTMSRVSLPKLVTCRTLNNAQIMKSFPNMNASTAFTFIFNEAARNLVNRKSLAVETQITRSLLHSLLIVLGEIQRACIELRNLVRTNFQSPHVGLLELELCFMDFKTGIKVAIILDMTCLNRGVYPLEIHPQFSITPTLESLSTEIVAAIKALKSGYSMVMRLCQCVSQVIYTSSI